MTTPASSFLLPNRSAGHTVGGSGIVRRTSPSLAFMRGTDLRRANLGGLSLLARPYRDDPYVHRCVKVIADAVSSVRLKIVDGEGKDAKEVTEGPLYELLRRPNPWTDANARSQTQMLRTVNNALQLQGECLLLLTDKQGLPLSSPEDDPDTMIEVPGLIWPVPGGSNRARAIPNSIGQTIGWEVSTDGIVRRYGAASVIMIKLDDPDDPRRGIAPMAAARRAANQNALAGRFQDNLLTRNGDPGGIIEVPDVLSEEDGDRLQEEIEERWDAIDFAGETRILWGGAKYSANKISTRDLQYPVMTNLNREVTATVFGVPLALMGKGSSNWATFQGDLRVFWTLTAMPLSGIIEDTLNCELMLGRLRGVNANHRIVVDTSAVAALQGTLEDNAKGAGALTKIGVPLNRALEYANITLDQPIDGGDVALVPSGLRPLSDVAAGLPAPSPLGLMAAASGSDQTDDLDPEPEPTKTRRVQRASEDSTDVPVETDTTATVEQRQALIAQVEDAIRPSEDWLNKKVRRVFLDMRMAQLQRLKDEADKGEAQQLAYQPIYRQALPVVSNRSYELLIKAWGEDATERSVLVSKGKLERHKSHWPKVKAWLDARPAARDHAKLDDGFHQVDGDLPAGAQRLLDVARLKALDIPEEEIDRLVVVMDAEFRESLTKWLQQGAVRGFNAGEGSIQTEFGADFFGGPADPKWIQVLRDKEIRVAEGVQSTVARQVRTTIIQTLTSHSTTGSLQMRILEAFDELEDSVRRSFNMHARRARTIARTEVGQSAAVARNARVTEGMETGSLSGARWGTAVPAGAAPPLEDGGFVRGEHHAMDGVKRGPGELYQMPDGTLLRHPKDPLGPPHQIINCRCYEFGIISPAAAGTQAAA